MSDHDLLLDPLTGREMDILALLADGLTDREIAERLGIGYNTVKWHNGNLFDKIGMRERRAAVKRAIELGLLDDDAPAPTYVKNNLPAQTTPFIGRKHELRELRQLLVDPDVRLITLLAPGGMGKTRLALALAEQFLGEDKGFPNGVFFVPLQALSSPEHIVSAIAEHSGYQFQQDGRELQQQLLDYFREKTCMLVIDNFEHLLDGAGIVTDILQAAPGVRIIITSREKLNLRGEKVYTIGGMNTTAADHLEADAVALFVHGVELVRTDFELQDDDLPILAQICSLVDGMPLAIVLAAAWAGVLSFQEIADEIKQSLDFLATEMRDTPQRHRSVQAVFEPTWKRLSEAERAVFMKCAVFRGGGSRQATQTITGATLPQLQILLNKALLSRTPEGRYMMHELLRQYAEAKLDASAGEAVAVRDAHSSYYLNALAEREDDLRGHRQLEALDEIESDFENVRAAWPWALGCENFEAVHRSTRALELFCLMRTRQEDGSELLTSAIDCMESQSSNEYRLSVAVLRAKQANLIDFLGKAAIEKQQQALAVARKYNDREGIAWCCRNLGWYYALRNDPDAAEPLLEEGLTIAREIGDRNAVARTLHSLALVGAVSGAYTDIHEQQFLEGITICRELGYRFELAAVLHNYGVVQEQRGQLAEAKDCLEESLALAHAISDKGRVVGQATALVGYRWADGDFEAARQLADEALMTAKDINRPISICQALSSHAFLARMQGNYAEAYQLVQEALDLGKSIGNFTVKAGQANALGFALCGLRKYEEASVYLCEALKLVQGSVMVGVMQIAVSGLALITAYRGYLERAAELLGLVFNHPSAFAAYILKRDPLLIQLRADLEADLGTAAYQAAWERGAALDLDTVVQELLDEYDQSQQKSDTP